MNAPQHILRQALEEVETFTVQPGTTLAHQLLFSPSPTQRVALDLLDFLDERSAAGSTTALDLGAPTGFHPWLELLASMGLLVSGSVDEPIQLTPLGGRIIDERRAMG